MASGAFVILPQNRRSHGNMQVGLKHLQRGIKIRRHSSSWTGSRSPCQLALSGNSGAVGWRHACVRLWLAVRVFECAWLCPFKTEISAIRSLPGRLCVCEAEEERNSTRRYTETLASSSTPKVVVECNNRQHIEKNYPVTDTREAVRSSGGSGFMVVSRGSDRDEQGLQSWSRSPLSQLVGNFSANSELQTYAYKELL